MQMPATQALPGVDVELVPVSPVAAPGKGMAALRLSRREFLVFGLGAGAGAVATFLGCYFAIRGRQPSGEGK